MEIIELRDAEDPAVEEIAARMRATLVEVLGEEEGGGMYSPAWLLQRVLTHIEGEGAVFVVRDVASDDMRTFGHLIVRPESGYWPEPFGLVATIYVDPAARREGLGASLIRRAERWFEERGLDTARTVTDANNEKLIRLFQKEAYRLGDAPEPTMVSLTKRLRIA